MMEQKLRLYLWWKGKLSERKQDGRSSFSFPEKGQGNNRSERQELSDALKKKDREKAERAGSRRRVRGGAPAPAASNRKEIEPQDLAIGEGEIRDEAEGIAEL